jgi:multidrug resistance efflux pump
MLDNLTAALSQLDVDVAAETADAQTAFAALEAEIAGLTAGTITQAQIDALTTQVGAASAALQAADAAAKAATPAPPAA